MSLCLAIRSLFGLEQAKSEPSSSLLEAMPPLDVANAVQTMEV